MTRFLPWRHCLVCLALWAVGDGMANQPVPPRARKVYVITQEDTSFVELLVAAFARLGLAPLQVDGVDTHSWDVAAAHADEFDLLWSVTPLSPAQLGKLSHRHKVNQLPGHDLVVSPAKRYGRYITLQGDHGRYEFNFMPPEFYFPRHKGAFVKAFEAMRGMARFSDRVNADPHFKRRWLVTKTAPSADPSTAAVTILTDPAQLEATPDQQLRIVHVVEPMLFSGHKAHVGVFVVVSSIDPLRIYIYHNVLLRMSVQKYPAALDSSSPRESFEVSDTSWLPPWEVDDLKAHYTELPSTQSEGTSHLKVLLRHLEHVGVDVAKFHKNVYSNVVKTIAASRGHFAKQARQASSQPSIDSFFQLFRFDMEIDDFGKPWVVSVEAQPSLEPQHFGSGSTGGLFSALTTDLVRLVGVLAPRDKTSAQLVVQADPTHCATHCDDRLRVWDMTCWRCPGWFTPPVATSLHSSATEYARRGRFHLAFPTTQGDYAEVVDGGLSPSDNAFHAYLTSFVVDGRRGGDAAPWDPSILCVNREQCSDHGNCINGRCLCDTGYEGHTCYLPFDPTYTMLPSRSIRVVANDIAPEQRLDKVLSSTHWGLVVAGLALACYGGYRMALHVMMTSVQSDKDN